MRFCRLLVVLVVAIADPGAARGALPLSLTRTIDTQVSPCECNFGLSLVVSGTSVLVGQTGNGPGSVQRFDLGTGELRDVLMSPEALPTGTFGSSLAVAAGHILVGDPGAQLAPNAQSAGAAYLYDIDTGTLEATFVPPAPVGSYYGFAGAVAWRAGNPLVTDADAAAVHLYDVVRGMVLRSFTLPAPALLPSNVVLATLGTDVVVGGRSVVYLFDGETGTLLRTFERADDPGFGSGVVAVADGDLLIGGSNAVYRYSAATGALVRRYRGVEHLLAATARLILASGPGCDESDVENDAAYVLEMRSGRTLAVLCNPRPDYLSRFGATGAFAGNAVVVSDPNEDTNQVYVFEPIVSECVGEVRTASIGRSLWRTARLLARARDASVDRARRLVARVCGMRDHIAALAARAARADHGTQRCAAALARLAAQPPCN